METKLLSTDRPISISYALPEDIASLVPGAANYRTVTFKTGKKWNLINTTIGTIDLQEVPGEEIGETIFTNNLSATCPGHEVNTPGDIAEISGRKLLIRIEYKSGLKKLIGNLEVAPRLYIKTASNTTTSRKVESVWKSPDPNYWLT